MLSDHIVLGPPDRQLTLTFLHCNPRHHTLALAPVPSPKRLNHIMLQLASIDDATGQPSTNRTTSIWGHHGKLN